MRRILQKFVHSNGFAEFLDKYVLTKPQPVHQWRFWDPSVCCFDTILECHRCTDGWQKCQQMAITAMPMMCCNHST